MIFNSICRSCGSFYNLQAISGSFEANPPFTEELMEEMVNHLEELLAGSTQPLSFVVSTTLPSLPSFIYFDMDRYLYLNG